MQVSKFGEEKEVVRQANDTKYGFTACLFAKSVFRIWRVSEVLEYGMVGINTGLSSTATASFGGVKSIRYRP